KGIERDDDSKKSHPTLAWRSAGRRFAPPARAAHHAPELVAGAGLSGAPPTETGPKGLGSGEATFRDVRNTRARIFELRIFERGMLEVVNGITAFCRASTCAASEES